MGSGSQVAKYEGNLGKAQDSSTQFFGWPPRLHGASFVSEDIWSAGSAAGPMVRAGGSAVTRTACPQEAASLVGKQTHQKATDIGEAPGATHTSGRHLRQE